MLKKILAVMAGSKKSSHNKSPFDQNKKNAIKGKTENRKTE